MTDAQGGQGGLDDDLAAIYGPDPAAGDLPEPEPIQKRRDFRPWHHPVKQIVRHSQWAELTRRHVRDGHVAGGVLKYFTLPGVDLLDVRVLAGVCNPLGVKIEYFGFDSAAGGDLGGPRVETEAALRQANLITASAVILPDRLEDIALAKTQAAQQLDAREPFHIVNIDACDHLAYRPENRDRTTFDALAALMRHQMIAKRPWLLFVTTRAEPSLLGDPGLELQKAVNDNLALPNTGFGAALAEAIEAEPGLLASALAHIWSTHGSRFLKLYGIGLSKYLLQFFHSQPNLPANVELASACAYRVHSDQPDMLALAFRITPEGHRVLPASVQGVSSIGPLEPQRAVRVATKARRMRDLDSELEQEERARSAIQGTLALLRSANYDLMAYTEWLATHDRRPVIVPPELLAS